MRYWKYMRIERGQNHLFEYSLNKKNGMDQEMEQIIWEYIDGICSPDQKAIIALHLAEDPVWQRKYSELMGIHDLLQKEELDMPSLRFSKNVMEEIAQYQVAP